MVLTYQEENFTVVQPEIAALTYEHWSEVTSNPEIEVDPDWDKFAELHKIGIVHVLTARSGPDLVGYVVLLTAYTLHYKSILMAHDDAFFLKKEYRKGLAGVKLFQAAEKMMKDKGANRIVFHEKRKVPTGKIFEFLGYTSGDVLWMKDI